MSFYKEVPGCQTTLESTLKFDTEPTAGSTNPVTSDGVAEALNESETNAVQFVFDDGDTMAQSIDDFTEEYYNSHILGNFYIEEGKVYVCTKREHSGDDYETKLEKVNGMVEALNKLSTRIAALNTGMGEVVAAALNDLYARVRANEDAVSETNLGDRTADCLDVQELLVGGEELNNVTKTVPNT